MKRSPDDPKKLLRCPAGCGNVINFIAVAKCVKCGTIRCDSCIKRFRKRPHCKKCARAIQQEESSK